jgi:hypothetical protein
VRAVEGAIENAIEIARQEEEGWGGPSRAEVDVQFGGEKLEEGLAIASGIRGIKVDNVVFS